VDTGQLFEILTLYGIPSVTQEICRYDSFSVVFTTYVLIFPLKRRAKLYSIMPVDFPNLIASYGTPIVAHGGIVIVRLDYR